MTQEPREHFRVEAGPSSLTEVQSAAAAWADDAVSTRLSTLRATAQHWQTTISTITGLFGAASVLNADKAVRALAPGWDYLYGGFVLLSLLCAALALKFASQAGDPLHVVIPPDIGDRVRLYDQVFEKAVNRLWWARLLAAPAVALLILALGVRWYAPEIVS